MRLKNIESKIAELEKLHAGLLARGMTASDVRTGLFRLREQLMAAAAFCETAAEALRIAMRSLGCVEIAPADSDEVVAAKRRMVPLQPLATAEAFLDRLSPGDAGQALETLRALYARLEARQALGRSIGHRR